MVSRFEQWRLALLALALPTVACSDETCSVDCAAPEAATIVMDFTGASGFFGSPFPSDARRGPDGRPDVTGFPNPGAVPLVDLVLDVLRTDVRGFGVSSGIFLQTTAALDPASLPTVDQSLAADASVQLIAIQDGAPDFGERYPLSVGFSEDPGPFGAPNLLTALPYQGVPLRPNERYALVVTRGARDAAGAPLGPSAAMTELVAGRAPEGMTEELRAANVAALDTVETLGVPRADVVGLAVFTTDDPVATLGLAVLDARANALPAPNEAFALTDEFPTYCVYGATIDMPVYQSGAPPYVASGGGWVIGEGGTPELQKLETARFFVTIPKSVMPVDGYPFVVFSRTGGGGDRPLIDRGVRAEPGGEAVTPGTGPALGFASVGYAGVEVDGPHGGPRNATMGDEQFLVFNIQNPVALRDNIRQSALELALLPEVLTSVTVDVTDCPGAVAPGNLASFSPDHSAIMGHSMGASIAPLAVVFEPRYRALLLSGAGGSFLANMLHKKKPIDVKPFAELLLGLTTSGYELGEHDPLLSMLQWAGEPADNPVYGRYIVREPFMGAPRNVLMMQGIVDHYIMPPIANATSLAMGLDLAGDALDTPHPEYALLDHLEDLLHLTGGSKIALPTQGNVMSSGAPIATAVVSQFPEDGLEDGHEAAYQTEPPKHAYTCFLASLDQGLPRVPASGAVGSPCE